MKMKEIKPRENIGAYGDSKVHGLEILRRTDRIDVQTGRK